jgi:hypothetical protein
MNTRTFISSLAGVLCLVSMASTRVVAEEMQSVPGALQSNAPVHGKALGALGAPLSESSLAVLRGGAEVLVNQQDLSAKMSNVSASNLTTGSNSITDGSFANANGLPIVIQNSGNGVIIQNSTILNLNVK